MSTVITLVAAFCQELCQQDARGGSQMKSIVMSVRIGDCVMEQKGGSFSLDTVV